MTARASAEITFDFLPSDGGLSLAIGDVMGKGMPAAILMTTVPRRMAGPKSPAASTLPKSCAW